MRKLLITLVAATLMLGGLTTVASAASPLTGTAQLTADSTNVLPGGAKPFAFNVTNTSASSLLNPGQNINYVHVTLPSSKGVTTTDPAVAAPTAPSGWTATVISTPQGLHAVKYQTTGSGIAPSASQQFAFPADVAAPANSDVAANFRVTISSNGGQTTETTTGNQISTVRVLEILDVGALAPAGVTDQSGTSGQAITYGVKVRNHAAQALTVTPKLASTGDDTIGNVAAASISSKAQRTFEFPVTLGAASGSPRTFTSGAEAPNAGALAMELNFTVQAAPTLTLKGGSLSPRFVRASDLLTYEFSVTAQKSGAPTLRLSDCTLSFANTTTTLVAPLDFAENSESKMLSFKSTTVSGSEGEHAPTIKCNGVDGNDFALAFTPTISDVITIDNTLPNLNVTLSIVTSNQHHTAVKNGDTVRIQGTMDEAASVDRANLRTNTGQKIDCTVPAGTNSTFTCTLNDVSFDGPTTEVIAEAQVTDRAGNIAGASSNVLTVDLHKPELTVARTESLSELQVYFEDQTQIRGGCNPTQWKVELNGRDRIVKDVLLNDENSGQKVKCTAVAPQDQKARLGADSFRYLVLADPLTDRDQTPTVSYDESSSPLADNVFDQAVQNATDTTLTAVTGIVPPAPQLLNVKRTDHLSGASEDAYREQGTGTKTKPNSSDKSDTYWTNQAGQDLEVEFGGGKADYKVRAVDGNGNPVPGTQKVIESSTGKLVVPIGNSDGRFVRGIQLGNAAGFGEPTYFDVVLDRIDPTISNATKASGTNDVSVLFSEIAPFNIGSNFANDWYAWEKVSGGREYYQPQRVSDGATAKERILTVPFEELGPFGGVAYLFTSTSENAKRYEDRAGNQLADYHP